ncbi:MAG: sigma-70 family RNA polymerase sigma factor [Pseudomonas sp.]
MSRPDPLLASDMHRLYSEHHHWLRQLLQRRLHCPSDAADLTHDTFLRVLAGRDLSLIREPRSYLATVARGLLINHYRRRELERAYLQALAQMPAELAPGPELRYSLLQTLIEIDAILDGLPAKVRTAFLLSQLEGLTYAQIAERLNVSHSSVKQYMLKAVSHCMSLAL